MFVSDWHDTGECHNYDKTHPSGRIYHVNYGKPASVNPDLAKQSDDELVKLQLHQNDWWVRQARLVLQERAHAGKLGAGVSKQLWSLVGAEKEATRKLARPVGAVRHRRCGREEAPFTARKRACHGPRLGGATAG